ncbi:NGG1p interacting factor NIF3 [Scytonema hofmannii PCC 7110]|uniref:GTP cyclohydrolase 1 type 2 homolog n=1 Tax=Scytonema hofmannii PCC 7110 TaxID=128403 RepID=A0A139X0J4_9CYAN|nr:Nif3-like dinuclear metal center hexameric protein [Scytonema hofmannii]KYC38227.1 NGG1p interacting factor NIF3 [Scytonema hofmannii PCC 7110]
MILERNSLLLKEIAEFLNDYLAIEKYFQEEQGGVYLPSIRPIKRLGLALEPWTELQEWVDAENLDAVFLHRPWKLQPGQLTPDIGVISYHLAFDERLTLSFNPELAKILGMSCVFVLGEKKNRPIGMIGDIPTQSFAELCDRISQIFGGYEQIRGVDKPEEVRKIAVVGAMTDELVREATNRGATAYITGQLRKGADFALQETKMNAIAVGHYRSEAWGLRALAKVLYERWSSLEIVYAL